MDLVVRDIQIFSKDKVLTPSFSFTFRMGFLYVLMGESGIGKSLFLQSISNSLPPNLYFRGSVSLDSSNLAYVFQDASTALNVSKPLRFFVDEMLRLNSLPWSKVEWYLKELNLDVQLLESYSFQLSGGQKQRFSILLALLSNRQWILLDEVNAGLDVENRQRLLNIIKREIKEYNRTIIWVSHYDPEIFNQADFILNIVDNEIVEAKKLDVSKNSIVISQLSNSNVLLSVEKLEFTHKNSHFKLGPISFSLFAHQKVLITGESGSGKSSLAKLIFESEKLQNNKGIVFHPSNSKLSIQQIQLIHQESFETFPPHLEVWKAVTDPAYYAGLLNRAERKKVLKSWFQKFDISEDILDKNVQECSGGQRQRLSIIRALLMQPKILICDEITAHIDAGLAVKVVKIIEESQAEMGFALLYITHRTGDLTLRFHAHYEMKDGKLMSRA